MKAQLLRLTIIILFLVTGLDRSVVSETVPSWTLPTPDRPALDVPYVPTPPDVINRMLSIADVNSGDILYDLGCGDGRIVVTAAKDRNVRKAIGIDLDPKRIRESNENARRAGVQEQVVFHQKNLFDVDFGEATVVSMYLLPSVNLKLRPKLLKELKPGSRIVSHDFDMADWQPDKTVQLSEHTIHYWVVPANVSGAWKWRLTDGNGEHRYELSMKQQFQSLSNARLKVDGADQPVSGLRVSGDRLEFTTEGTLNGERHRLHFRGTVKDNSVRGTVSSPQTAAGKKKWTAKRAPGTAGSIEPGAAGRLYLQG